MEGNKGLGSHRPGQDRERNQGAQPQRQTPQLPDAPPFSLLDPNTLPGWEMERDLRAARAKQSDWMLRMRRHGVQRADEESRRILDSAIRREAPAEEIAALKQMAAHRAQEASRAAEMYIAQAVGRSEYVVSSEINAAERAVERLPRTWRAFLTGRICDLRLRRITSMLDRLRTPESVEALDEKAPSYAETHKVGELTSWLKQFEHRAEPTEAAERATKAARERRVSIQDLEDGMSLISALVPTVTAQAIKRRLDLIARSATDAVPHNPLIAEDTTRQQLAENDLRLSWLANHQDHILDAAGMEPDTEPDTEPTNGPLPRAFEELPTTREIGDPRSLDQRSADLFCAWLLNPASAEDLNTAAQIGVLVEESTLTGDSEAPAFIRDSGLPIPASQLRNWLRVQTEAFSWHQLIHRGPPDSADLLAVHSAGRHPPEHLRVALWYRDRTCTAYGCRVSAERCDADHIQPWPQGSTSAENLQLLCRRHHRLKSWGYEVHLPPLSADFVQAA